MRAIVTFLLLNVLFQVFSQTNPYTAMLLHCDGMGIYTRNGMKYSLRVPMSFISGDEIELLKGSAHILFFSGEEKIVSGRELFVVPSFDFGGSDDIFSYANSESGVALTESSFFYTKEERVAFPAKSKVLGNEKVQLFIPNFSQIKNPKIYVRDYATQKDLYSGHVDDSVFVIENVKFKNGKLYSWMIVSDNKMPALGTIAVVNEDETFDLKKNFELDSHFDFVSAISFYAKNEYIFKAIQIADRARNLYPEYSVYSTLKFRIFQH